MPLSADRKFYTVSELSLNIKRALDQNPMLSSVWVKGEISNVKYHSSGHIYFSIKDRTAVINATFFKYANRNLRFKLEDGMSIFALGSVSLYEKGGSYSFNINTVEKAGEGELQQKIEELKRKLQKEGLFDPSEKKDLPILPKRIGIVTSPTGAAVRDIIKVALRRYPNVELLIAPAKVQGDDAAASIVQAIKELNRAKYGLDLIIAGRGGGSFEDLMAFNEEKVVRAFASSELPVISAVGHQIDHPLSDDAADRYAPTPSAAAEIAVPEKQVFEDEINRNLMRIDAAVNRKLSVARNQLENLMKHRIFSRPEELAESREMDLQRSEIRLISVMKNLSEKKHRQFASRKDLYVLIENILVRKRNRLDLNLQAMRDRSPLNIIQRGYSIARDSSGRIIKHAGSVKAGDKISVKVADGTIGCTVESSEEGEISVGKKTEKSDIL